MNSERNSIDPIDGYDLGKFRGAVAKYVKLMIRARAKSQPEFLSEEQYARWNLSNIASDLDTIELLLRKADAAHDHLWRTFIGPHGSGGVAEGDPRGELKEAVVGFTITKPHAQLLEALASGAEVDWAGAAEWELLDTIRDGLDALPELETVTSPVSDCPVVVVNSSARDVEVLGKPIQVKKAQMDVIQTLINAYPHSLTKDQLASRSEHGDAVNILKRLRKSDQIWEKVIHLAGEAGGGYALIKLAAS